jgi:hypothetical protein
MAIGDQSNNPIYDMVTPEGTITNPFFSGRLQIIGTPNLDAVRSVNAAYRAGIRGDRALCNAAGGLVGGGGSQCYFGEEAYNKAESVLAGNAPAAIKTKAQEWLDANPRETEDTTTDADTGEDPSEISDADAISSVLATVPDQLKGIITADNVIKVLEAGAQMNDPMTKIKRAMGAGVQFEFPSDWKNWKVFGPLAIPGVPLPPGIIDITIEEVIDAVGDLGGFISDPLGTLGELGTTIKNTVEGVFNGTITDPGWGGTLGGLEDWVTGVLGSVVGGAVFTDIYEDVKDVFTQAGDSTTIVPGGTETGDGSTETAVSSADLGDEGDGSNVGDIFVDSTDDGSSEILTGGGDTLTGDGNILTGGDSSKGDDILIGGGSTGDGNDDEVTITSKGGDNGDDITTTGDGNDDEVTITSKGGDNGDDITTTGNGNNNEEIITSKGGDNGDNGGSNITFGGNTDIIEIEEDPPEIGGTEESNGGSSFGGGGMLTSTPSDPFGIRPIQITASPALQARIDFPITNFLLAQGMFTGNRNILG